MRRIVPYLGPPLLLILLVYLVAQRSDQPSASAALPSGEIPVLRVAVDDPIAVTLREPERGEELDILPILERPIFEPGRRPYAPELAEPEVLEEEPERPVEPAQISAPVEQELPPPQITLMGILISEQRPIALIAINADDPEWRAVGEDIQGWQIREITTDWIELVSGESSIQVDLYQ
jgi:hypothetical protein